MMVDVTLPADNDDIKIWARVALDLNGHVIASDRSSHRIFTVSPQGDFSYTPSLTLSNGILQGFSGLRPVHVVALLE